MMDGLPDQNHHIHLCEERGVVRRHQGAPPPHHHYIYQFRSVFRDSLRLWKYLDQEIVASVEMLTTGSCKLSTYQMDAIALIWDW